MIGDIIFPNNIPNLYQIKFNGYKIFEFNKPRIKKTIVRKIKILVLKFIPKFK